MKKDTLLKGKIKTDEFGYISRQIPLTDEMRKVLLQLLPEKWVDEINERYYRGVPADKMDFTTWDHFDTVYQRRKLGFYELKMLTEEREEEKAGTLTKEKEDWYLDMIVKISIAEDLYDMYMYREFPNLIPSSSNRVTKEKYIINYFKEKGYEL